MEKRVAVLTSGGDAPGMNAAVRAVVRASLRENYIAFGIRSGYTGLIEGDFISLDSRAVANIIQSGGTILKTSRCAEFKTEEGLEKARAQLQKHAIDALVVVGGDGSFRGALNLQKIWDGQVLGIPGTIDNDLYGTDETIGFDTAVNTALGAIDKIRDTADAHGRFFLIEVMGRLSGYIALYAGLAGGAEAALVPEYPQDLERLSTEMREYQARGKFSSILIVAEGFLQERIEDFAKRLENLCGHPYRVVVLGHLLRGGSPTAKDRILGSRLGEYAVSLIAKNVKGCMVGCIKNEHVYTPLHAALEHKKELLPYEYQLLYTLS